MGMIDQSQAQDSSGVELAWENYSRELLKWNDKRCDLRYQHRWPRGWLKRSRRWPKSNGKDEWTNVFYSWLNH